MGLDSLGARLKALPFKKPTTYSYVDDISGAIPLLKKELLSFYESTGYRQFTERHTTQYLVETNGFFLRGCGNILPYNIDTGEPESTFSVFKRYEADFPYTYSVMSKVALEGDLIFTRWGYSIIEPKAKVLPHLDNTTYLYLGKRCMVELNESDYEFYVEDVQLPCEPGAVFEFNNNTMHYGSNAGSTQRLALIFDWIPNSWRP